jgi:hypothetical protein
VSLRKCIFTRPHIVGNVVWVEKYEQRYENPVLDGVDKNGDASSLFADEFNDMFFGGRSLGYS